MSILERIEVHLKVRLEDKPFDLELLSELQDLLNDQGGQLAQFLLGDEDGSPPNKIDYGPIRRVLLAERKTKKGQYDLLAALYYWVLARNELDDEWQLEMPPAPYFTAALVSPFAEEARGYVDLIEQYGSVLDRSCRAGGNQIPEWKAGQFLVSAILNGRLHDIVQLRACTAAQVDYQCYGDVVWSDLVIQNDENSEPEVRRWFVDEVTEALALSLPMGAREILHGYSGRRSFSSKAFKLICQFFLSQGLSQGSLPSNLTELLKMANYEFALGSSFALAGYASRKNVSHSLKPIVWGRLLGAASKSEHHGEVADEPVADAVTDVTEAVTFEVEKTDAHLQLRRLVDTWHQERDNNKTFNSDDAKRALKDIAEDCSPVIELLGRWVFNLVFEIGLKDRSRLSPNTIKGYLSTAGKRLIDAAGNAPLLLLDAEGFEDLYWHVLEDAGSNSLKRSVSKGLAKFHQFLVDEYGAPKLENSRALGFGTSAAAVDANIITLDEYYLCMEAMRTDRALNLYSADLASIARMVFMVGFFCGTRRNEILKLRICDLHFSGKSEMFIRPWFGRRLKTKSSNRKVPIQELLEEEALDELEQFWERRIEEELEQRGWDNKKRYRPEIGNQYLFAISSLSSPSVAEEVLFPHIHRIMREVTGDETLRFHHLRHSFATWACLRLTLLDGNSVASIIEEKHPKTADWLSRSVDFRRALLGSARNTRKALYCVGSILGHSGPDMSVQHYVHALDVLMWANRPAQPDARTLGQAASLSTGSIYHALKKDEFDQVPAVQASIRKRAKKAGRITNLKSLDNMLQVDNPGGDVCVGGYETLMNLDSFLQVFAQLEAGGEKVAEFDSEPFQDLCVRFGYSVSQGQKYIERAQALAHLETRPISYKQVLGASLSPVTKMNDQKKAELRIGAERAFAFKRTRGDDLENLIKHSLNTRWSSPRGLMFRSGGEEELARVYMEFSQHIFGNNAVMQYRHFEGANEEVRVYWRTVLSEGGEIAIGPDVARTNKQYSSLKNTLLLRPMSRHVETRKMPETENPVIRILLHLLAICEGET